MTLFTIIIKLCYYVTEFGKHSRIEIGIHKYIRRYAVGTVTICLMNKWFFECKAYELLKDTNVPYATEAKYAMIIFMLRYWRRNDQSTTCVSGSTGNA